MPWQHWSAERLGVALAVLAALGFSFKAIFVKLAYAAAPVDAVTLLSLRMVFSLPAFLWVGFVASRSAPPLTRNDWAMLVALGLLGYYGASILDFIGLQYISAGLERLILFTYPTLTLLIGVLFMGKSLSRREMASLLLSYAGIGLAFAHDLETMGETTNVLIGAAFVFASSLSYALYLAGSGPAIARLGAARFTALAMLVSTLATQVHFLATQPFSALLQPLPVYGACLVVVGGDGADRLRPARGAAGPVAHAGHSGCLPAQGFVPCCAGGARRPVGGGLVHGFAAVIWSALVGATAWRGWAGAVSRWRPGHGADDRLAFLPGAEPVLNNYIPVLKQPLFFASLWICGAGFSLAVLRALITTWPRPAFSASRCDLAPSSVRWRLSWRWPPSLVVVGGAAGRGNDLFEVLFWGGGHTLQFQHAC
jgi:drug/metabolite transporter (DMT)-like permease